MQHKAQLMIGIPTTDFHCFWQELNFFAWFVANFPANEGPFSPYASIRPKCRVQRLWQSRASNKLALYHVFTRRLPRHSAPFSWRSKMPVTSQDFSLNLGTKPLRFTRPNDTLYNTIRCSMYVQFWIICNYSRWPWRHLDPSLQSHCIRQVRCMASCARHGLWPGDSEFRHGTGAAWNMSSLVRPVNLMIFKCTYSIDHFKPHELLLFCRPFYD